MNEIAEKSGKPHTLKKKKKRQGGKGGRGENEN